MAKAKRAKPRAKSGGSRVRAASKPAPLTRPGPSAGYDAGHLVSTGDPRRFYGVPTLLRAPLMEHVAKPTVGLVGIPFDGGVIRTPGTRFGPRAIRAASFRASNYDPDTRSVPMQKHRVVDCGDVVLSNFSIADAYRSIERAIRALLARGIFPIGVGGDHSITTPILRAMRAKYGKLAVVQFDAHADVSDTAYGQPHHHGTPFRRSVEEGLIDGKRMIQVGIRKHYYENDEEFAKRHGFEVITTRDLKLMGPDLRTKLARRFRRLKGRPIYVTFDIDFLDQAYAPGTGGPEPFGPTSYEAHECLKALAVVADDIVGFDLNEVSPPLDLRDQTSLLAVQLLFDMISILPPTV
jgi:guanidinobutyrase